MPAGISSGCAGEEIKETDSGKNTHLFDVATPREVGYGEVVGDGNAPGDLEEKGQKDGRNCGTAVKYRKDSILFSSARPEEPR